MALARQVDVGARQRQRAQPSQRFVERFAAADARLLYQKTPGRQCSEDLPVDADRRDNFAQSSVAGDGPDAGGATGLVGLGEHAQGLECRGFASALTGFAVLHHLA